MKMQAAVCRFYKTPRYSSSGVLSLFLLQSYGRHRRMTLILPQVGRARSALGTLNRLARFLVALDTASINRNLALFDSILQLEADLGSLLQRQQAIFIRPVHCFRPVNCIRPVNCTRPVNYTATTPPSLLADGIAILYPYRTCPAHAGTNLGCAAGRDMLRPEVHSPASPQLPSGNGRVVN